MRVLLFLFLIITVSPAFAGCLYICGNGVSCSVTCDGGGMFTVPDPLTMPMVDQNPREPQYADDSYYDDSRPSSEFSNVSVNDLPNSEEPDVFVMDFESQDKPGIEVVICDYDGNEELYCREL